MGEMMTRPDRKGHWRDKDVIVEQLSEAIYYTHPRRDGLIWENLTPDVKDWVRAQARTALDFLEKHDLLQTELVRSR